MNIAVITSGFLPVPPTKGGAVENLLYNLIKYNEKEMKVNFNIFSIYDKKAEEDAKKFKYTKIKFFKINHFIKCLDKMIFIFAKYILKKKNSQSYRFILQRLSFLNKISKDLKKNNYDKVLLENHPTQYLALKWRKNYIKYNGRYYYHCHNEFPSEYGCDKIIKNTKKIICVSKYIQSTLEKYKIAENKFVVLRNGVDENKFNSEISENKRLEIRKKYNIKKDNIVLIYTGRIVPEKGVLELVKAFNQINEKNLKLLIVGSALNAIKNKTLYEEKVEKEISKNSNIIFTGFIEYSHISDVYKISDIAVLPSLWDDPAPLTIIESMRCGLAIITTKSGGIPEYATNKCAIFIDKNKNVVENLKNSIEDLIENKGRLLEMSKESIKASGYLTNVNFYEKFCDIIGDKNG